MRYVRQLSRWTIYLDTQANDCVNFIFTRAFLGDEFKGHRTQNHRDFSCISDQQSSQPVHIRFANSSDNFNELDSVDCDPNDVKTESQINCSNKYFSSLSYTLKQLNNSSSDLSDTDSSLSDNSTNKSTVDFNFLNSYKTSQCRTNFQSSNGNSQLFNEFDLDFESDTLDKMFDEMINLGLPTKFGHKKRKISKIRQSNFEIEQQQYENQIEQKLLIYASRIKRLSNLMDCKTKSFQTICLSLTDLNDMHVWNQNSSFDLNKTNHQLESLVFRDMCLTSVFTRLCYVLELACIFDDKSLNLTNEWDLNLPNCWSSSSFNLDAFLYNCRTFWRYKPPPISKKSIKHQIFLNETVQLDNDPLVEKYWAQRFRLFSRFDAGIRIDRDGLFSATPEVIAVHQAKRFYRTFGNYLKSDTVGVRVLDIFSGTGSNAIQLALRGFNVTAIELDPVRNAMAMHNAEIYGVRSRIEFVCEDFFSWAWKIIRTEKSNHFPPYLACLLSPPWGGPGYLNQSIFDLNTIAFQNEGQNLWSALYLASYLSRGNVCLFLPRNTNIAQFVQLSSQFSKQYFKSNYLNIEFEISLINFKSKALTVYFGQLANSNHPDK